MHAPPTEPIATTSSSGYEDGLGRRVLAFDRRDGGLLERLYLRPQFSAFEPALADLVARVSGVTDDRIVAPLGVERDEITRELVLVSPLAGDRLSDLLDGGIEQAREDVAVPSIDVALGFLIEALAALESFRLETGLSHGVLSPTRIVFTPHGRIGITECVFGTIMPRLALSRSRLWTDFRVAMPPVAGATRFDCTADVAQAAMIALMLADGRPLDEPDAPEMLPDVIADVVEIAQIRSTVSFAIGLQKFLQRALPLAGRRPYLRLDSALADVREVASHLGIDACLAALSAFGGQAARHEDSPASADSLTDFQEPTLAPDRVVVTDFAPLPQSTAAVPEDTAARVAPAADDAVGQVQPVVARPLEALPVGFHPLDRAEVESAPTAESRPVEAHPHEPDTHPVQPPQIPAPLPARPPASIEPAASAPPTRRRRARRERQADLLRSVVAPPAPVASPAPVAPAPSVTPPATIAAVASEPIPTAGAGVMIEPPPDVPFEPPPQVMPVLGSPMRLPTFAAPAGALPTAQAPPPTPPVATIRVVAPTPVPAQPVFAPSPAIPQPVFQPVATASISPYFAPQPTAPTQPALVRIKTEPPAGYAPARSRYAVPAEVPPAARPRRVWQYVAAAAGIAVVLWGATVTQVPDRTAIPVEASGAARRPVPPPPAPAVGFIQAETQPAGARVLLDGDAVGETPLRIADVSPGRHVLTFITPTATVTRTVRIEAGRTLKVDVPVFSGWVAVFAPIVLEISENGQALGTTEQGRLLLPPGRHTLTLSSREFGYSASHVVDIQPGEVRSLNVEPRGTVNLNAVPWAEVWVDGRKVGDTPIANLQLPVGNREIVFKHPQHGDRRLMTLVTAAAPAVVSVNFMQNP